MSTHPLAPSSAALRRSLGLTVALLVLLGLWVPLARPAAAAVSFSPLGDRTGYAVGGNLQDRSDVELARELDLAVASGARWVRLDVNWASTERRQGVREWAPMDRVVTAITSRGLSVLGLVTYAPAWARPAGSAHHAAPTDAQAFAAFAGAAAERYTPRGITAWEVWNEPNIHNFWSPAPDVRQYADLLTRTSAAIRAVNPRATIVSGGLSPAHTTADGLNMAPLEFMKRLYDLGAGPSFDAVGWHPYSFPHMPTTPNTSSWNAYQQMPLLREEMVRRGDSAKKVWLTEVGAPTGTAADAVSEQRQADIVVEAVTTAGGWSWAGPTFVYAVRDAGTLASDREDNFGLVRRDYSPKPAFTALRTALGAAATAPVAAPTAAPTTAPSAPSAPTEPTTAPSTEPTTVPSQPTTAPTTETTAPSAPVAAPHVQIGPVVPVTTAPAAPTGVTALGGPGIVRVGWTAAPETAVVGHHVYRTTDRPGTTNRRWTRLTAYPLAGTLHNDRTVRNGIRYYYRLTAVSTLESSVSAEASAMPNGSSRTRLGARMLFR